MCLLFIAAAAAAAAATSPTMAIDSQKQRDAKRHPTLGDYVIVGAGAQILGPITVSRCARIGGNSVVTKDVPEGATVVGVPARQISKGDAKPSGEISFMPYAVHSGLDSDPRERTIRALVDAVQSQRSAPVLRNSWEGPSVGGDSDDTSQV